MLDFSALRATRSGTFELEGVDFCYKYTARDSMLSVTCRRCDRELPSEVLHEVQDPRNAASRLASCHLRDGGKEATPTSFRIWTRECDKWGYKPDSCSIYKRSDSKPALFSTSSHRLITSSPSLSQITEEECAKWWEERGCTVYSLDKLLGRLPRLRPSHIKGIPVRHLLEAPNITFAGRPMRGRPDLLCVNDTGIALVECKYSHKEPPKNGHLSHMAQLWCYSKLPLGRPFGCFLHYGLRSSCSFGRSPVDAKAFHPIQLTPEDDRVCAQWFKAFGGTVNS